MAGENWGSGLAKMGTDLVVDDRDISRRQCNIKYYSRKKVLIDAL
jgi:hypothetical protein